MAEDITANVKGNKLVIEVDVSPDVIKNAPMTKSGKNKLVASTRGSLKVGQFSVGLNVFTK